MEVQKPQVKLDISKTTPILNAEGGMVWVEGFILRKVSRFITGGTTDSVVPIPIFYNPTTMEICREGLPPEMDFLFETQE